MGTDTTYMSLALEEAKLAGARDEVPIAAIIVDPATGEIVAKDSNRTRELSDPTAHAEIGAIREACLRMGSQRIHHLELYTTLEPCTMCASAISFARIKRVIIGAPDPKGGGIFHGAKFYTQPTCHHKPEVTSGVLKEECSEILKDFFKAKR